MKPSLRVLHCPAHVGGHAVGLARAERKLGLDSHVLLLEEPPPGFEGDEVLFPHGTGVISRELRRWRFALGRLRAYDVVHFNFGSTLMPWRHRRSRWLLRVYAALVEGRDLDLLPRGTAVFVTFQGDDARQRRPRFASLPADHFDTASDLAKRRRIARLSRRADAMFALNPDLLDVLPPSCSFLPYANVDLEAWRTTNRPHRGELVVVHAPSARGIKGTDVVVRAAAQLQAEGIGLELVLIEGLSRDETRVALERADVVIDQLLIGWYGGIAVEGMALAKPVIAHIADDDLARMPRSLADALPIVRASPSSLADKLRELLTVRAGELPTLGARGRAFVERWHDPLVIARKMSGMYVEAIEKRRNP